MATTKVYAKTATMPAYGVIFPVSYNGANKYPTVVFGHGIGESGKYKSIQACVDFHWFLKKAADVKGIVYVLPQDEDADIFSDGEVQKVWPIARDLSDGRMGLCGLSMGGGATTSIAMSTSAINNEVTFYGPCCPPSWESLGEQFVAAKTTPFWIFAGGKDASVSISSILNTVGDIRAAGRMENFYFTCYPEKGHAIWEQVFGLVPPATPADAAAEYGGQGCVNNPAIDIWDYFLMQRPGDYKALPLKDAVTTPPIVPPTPEDAVYIKDVNYDLDAGIFAVQWLDGQPAQVFRPKQGEVFKNVYARDNKAENHLLTVTPKSTTGATPSAKFNVGPAKAAINRDNPRTDPDEDEFGDEGQLIDFEKKEEQS